MLGVCGPEGVVLYARANEQDPLVYQVLSQELGNELQGQAAMGASSSGGGVTLTGKPGRRAAWCGGQAACCGGCCSAEAGSAAGCSSPLACMTWIDFPSSADDGDELATNCLWF